MYLLFWRNAVMPVNGSVSIVDGLDMANLSGFVFDPVKILLVDYLHEGPNIYWSVAFNGFRRSFHVAKFLV